MAVFTATVSGVAPLRIQLHAVQRLKLLSAYVACEAATGNMSLPSLSRPSTPGNGTGVAQPLSGFGISGTPVATTFFVAPSLPSTGTGAYNIPWNTYWVFKPGSQPELQTGDFILLYANADTGLTLSGELTWSEDGEV